MKKLILVASVFCASLLSAQTDQQKADRVDSVMQVYAKKDMFTGSVLIAKKGKVLFSKGYGLADVPHAIANTADTKFKLASVTKQFTAMSVMILEEKGKL